MVRSPIRAPLNNASKLTVQQPELPPGAGDADADVVRSQITFWTCI